MKALFWIRYTTIMMLFGIMSVLSIVLFPVAYFFRYKLKLDLFWIFLNDETDFGEQWWKKREGITKDTFFTAWKWNVRDSAWNFKTNYFKPTWTGSYSIYKVVKNTLSSENPLEWANKRRGVFGVNHVYYTVNRIMYGRYSYADEFIEVQLGSAGNRYKMHLPINPVNIYKSIKKQLS